MIKVLKDAGLLIALLNGGSFNSLTNLLTSL